MARVADRGDHHPVAVLLGILLNHHGVRALRDRGAGEDAHRLAGPQLAGKAMTGGALADDPQGARAVGGAHRPAVHGRGGERRLIARGGDVHRQNPSQRQRQGNSLGLERRGGGEHARARLLDAEQPHAPRQSPDAPPLFSTSLTASMVMPRSAALSMS